MIRFFRNLFRRYNTPSIPFSSPEAAKMWSTWRTNSGLTITPERSLTYSPVWQAVDLITSDVARLPALVYERVESEFGEGKSKARAHPAYRLLRRHTGDMTAVMFIVRWLGHALLHGNGYARVVRDSVTGSPARLQWLHSDRVDPQMINGERVYRVNFDQSLHGMSGIVDVEADSILHLEGLALDEFGGQSIVGFARNTIGRMLSGERYSDDFFKNGAEPRGWLEVPDALDDDTYERLKKEFQERHQGKFHRLGILEDGIKYHQTGTSPKDAMLIELLAWGVKDIARFFNLPPHKLGDESRTSFASVESENRSYFNSSLGKWISRIECELTSKMLLPEEFMNDTHFVEFETKALFRADTNDRFNAYAIAVQNGIMSRNEARASENMNPYEGGEQFLTPLNMTTGAGMDEPPPTEDGNGSRQMPLISSESRVEAIRSVLEHSVERSVRYFVRSAAKAARKPHGFLAWLNEFESAQRKYATDVLSPALRAAGVPDSELAAEIAHVLEQASREFLQVTDRVAIDEPKAFETQILDTESKILALCDARIGEIMTQHWQNAA